jgi:hypothetical protein
VTRPRKSVLLAVVHVACRKIVTWVVDVSATGDEGAYVRHALSVR